MKPCKGSYSNKRRQHERAFQAHYPKAAAFGGGSLLDGYAALQKSLGITPDLWLLLAIILVIVTISPELTFLGFESPSSNKKTKATSPVSESKEEIPQPKRPADL